MFSSLEQVGGIGIAIARTGLCLASLSKLVEPHFCEDNVICISSPKPQNHLSRPNPHRSDHGLAGKF
jgi:hypothetical protein